MNCNGQTIDIVGVRGECSGTTPLSSLYFEDLPGVDLGKAADVAEAQITGIQVARSAIEWGERRVKTDLINRMLKYVRFKQIHFSKFGAVFQDNSYAAAKAGARGISIDMCMQDCRLLGLYIPRVQVQFQNTGAGVLVLNDGSTTKSVDFNYQRAGQPFDVWTHFRPNSDKVEITIDSATLEPNESTLNNECFECYPEYFCQGTPGASITGIGDNASLSYGIRPLINKECSEDKFFCEIANLLGQEILYASGIWFADQAQATGRINDFTLYSVDELMEVKEGWKEEYDKLIDLRVEMLPEYLSRIDSCCIVCNSDHFVYSHP